MYDGNSREFESQRACSYSSSLCHQINVALRDGECHPFFNFGFQKYNLQWDLFFLLNAFHEQE